MGSVGTAKYVSQKVSVVRWQPSRDTAAPGGQSLAIGSWDDEVNTVSLWKTEGTGLKEVGKADIKGNVTGLEWNGPDMVLATSSGGDLTALKVVAGGNLEQAMLWQGLHRAGAGGCTALSLYGDGVATAGQDGRINVLAGDQREPVKVYDKGDSCSLTALSYTRSSELVSANMRGQLKTWDLRSNSRESVTTASHGTTIVTCLAKHPTQAHILVSGGGDGVLAVWDLRNHHHPCTLLSAHTAPLSEVAFHPSEPDHLFTCSQGGDICHWNGSSIRRPTAGMEDNLNTTTTSPWLSTEAVKHKVEKNSLVTQQPLPVNSLDVVGHSVVFGGDNEAFYVLHNVIF